METRETKKYKTLSTYYATESDRGEIPIYQSGNHGKLQNLSGYNEVMERTQPESATVSGKAVGPVGYGMLGNDLRTVQGMAANNSSR